MDINKLCPYCLREMNTEDSSICPICYRDTKKAYDVTHQLKPFTILQGKYLVGGVLGEGGFGITYIGLDINLEIPVAIKEFYPNGFATRESQVTSVMTVYTGDAEQTVIKWRDNFLKEARMLAKCANLPGVVGVKEFFQENQTAYIVQEYLEGETLKEYAKSQGGKIPCEQLLASIRPVLQALAQVHKQGLIHRDISPDNIMLLQNGQMKLLDFGAARDFTQEGEKSLSVLLKPGYAPEEQYRTKGMQGPWSDIYALGGTLYKCLTGMTPPEAMERMRNDPIRWPSQMGIDIPEGVEQTLQKAMAVFAENRYQTMEEFYRDLYDAKERVACALEDAKSPILMTGTMQYSTDSTVSMESTVTMEGTEVAQTKTGSPKKLFLIIAGSVAALCILVLGIWIAFSGGKKQQNQEERELIIKVQQPSDTVDLPKTENGDMMDVTATDEVQPETEDTFVDSDMPDAGQIVSEQEYTAIDESELNQRFLINSTSQEAYGNVLNPSRWAGYASSYPDFYYCYPNELFNYVQFTQEPVEVNYGINLESTYFVGTGGTEMICAITERTDDLSVEEMTQCIEYYECEASDGMISKIKCSADEQSGILVATGNLSNGKLVYEFYRVTPAYVMQMNYMYPDYLSVEDKIMKDYVMECIYRMCGFSGTTTSWRPYDEFYSIKMEEILANEGDA